MNKSINKSLKKKLMIVSLIIMGLTLISNTTRANATPRFKNVDNHFKYFGKKINELWTIKDDGSEWANPDKKAIYSNEDGHIFVLNAKVVEGADGEEQQYMTIDEYDNSVSYLSSKIVLLPYSQWGGFYNCEEERTFYVVVGQNNEEEDDKKVVYTVIKYNSEWKEIKRLDITGKESKTVMPFKYENCNISYLNGILTIEDYRKAYSRFESNNNEEVVRFNINTSTMKVE